MNDLINDELIYRFIVYCCTLHNHVVCVGGGGGSHLNHLGFLMTTESQDLGFNISSKSGRFLTV